MPRSYPMAHTVNGKHVGFKLKKRQNENTYTVYFRARDGRRVKRATQLTTLEKAKEAAAAIIDAEYLPATVSQEAVSWPEAEGRMAERAAADGIRAPTIDYYRKLIRRIRTFYPRTFGPADVSEDMAQRWKKTFSSTPTRRKELPSQHTTFSLVRGFSALWETWFVGKLGVCPINPWKDVEPPKTDKVEVRKIEEDVLTDFLAWLDKRFSGWELPRLFIETKAVTGCRLMDLAGVESVQLRDGKLHFRPDQTKGRKGRASTLPADLFARLDALKGPTYLWESYPAGLVEAVRKMGCPVHRIKPNFVPRRLYHWVETLFLDYRAEDPKRPQIHSHQLRKRAFTAAWKNNIDPRKAAIAYGCNVDTVMKHYVVMDEQEVTDEVTGQLAGCLTPKK